MGVMHRRLGAAALVLIALYATFFRAVAPVEESGIDPRQVRLYELSRHQRNVILLWSALASRDSALARLETTSIDPGEPRIVAVGFPAGAAWPEAAALIRTRWKEVGAADPSIRIMVLLYNGAEFHALRSNVYPYSGAFVAPAFSGEVCAVLTPGTLTAGREVDIVPSQLERALAPCMLRAGFGAPGRGVSDWLQRTRSAAAKSNAWLYRPRDFLDGRGQLPWEPIYDPERSGMSGTTLSSLLRGVAAREIAMMSAPPYLMGGPALRCLAGNPTECSRTVLDSVSQGDELPRELTASWWFMRESMPNAILATHSIGEWFLSDLIRREGRERFARFWRSQQPFETAFREAFALDLGEWTRAWGVRQTLGSWEGFDSRKPVVLGANLAPSWPLLALGWTVAALALAAWTARRRQVT